MGRLRQLANPNALRLVELFRDPGFICLSTAHCVANRIQPNEESRYLKWPDSDRSVEFVITLRKSAV